MITKNQIKFIKSLKLKKNRLKHQLFIVEGEKNVKELLDSDYKFINIYATKYWINHNREINAINVTSNELKYISNQTNPNEVLAIVKINNYKNFSKSGVILVLDEINNPGNMGTILRICDWFGIYNIVCSNNTVDIYNPKVVQASMGSIFRVRVIYTNLLDYLLKVNTPVYGAFLDGENVRKISFPKNFHLVVGNEANGISENITSLISKKVSIPNFSRKIDSLNVAVATSIFLHEISN
tara:strand:- start:2215 stop:2931 length:717 start_codon:yes stop_codon:yes gene_type:complete